MRQIDADELKAKLSNLEARGGHKYYRQGMDDVLHKFMPTIIDEQPTVEQPRCCGCAYYEGENDSVHGICINPKCGKSWHGCPVKSDFFCGHWESMEE